MIEERFYATVILTLMLLLGTFATTAFDTLNSVADRTYPDGARNDGGRTRNETGNDTGPDSGNVTVVDPDGGPDHTSMQEAVDRASPGDTIRLAAGVHNESVVINKSLRLIGNGSETTFVTAEWSYEKVTVSASDVLIRGVTFRNSTDVTVPFSHGIYLLYADNVTIENCTFRGNFRAVDTTFCDNVTIRNNTFYDNYYGMYFESSHNIVAENNNCSSNYYYGIYAESSRNMRFESNNCSENRYNISESWGPEDFSGIYLITCTNATLRNNTCGSNTFHGIYLGFSNHVVLTGNTLDGNGFGIYAEKSRGIVAENNTCRKNTVHGLFFLHCSESEIGNNVCDGNYESGIVAHYSSVGITDNECGGNYVNGITFHYSEGIIENNTCRNNYGNGLFTYYSDFWAYNNNFSSNLVSGVNMVGDFGYVVNSTCSDNGYPGIIIRGKGMGVFDNTCHGNAVAGIELLLSTGSLVENNDCSRNYGSGILVSDSENNTVRNNSLTFNRYGLTTDSSSLDRIVENRIASNDLSGIRVKESYGEILTGNRIEENGGNGLYEESGGHNIVLGNDIHSNDAFGIYLDNASQADHIFLNEFVTNNAGNVQAYDGGSNNTFHAGGAFGNYWSDLEDRYPGARRTGDVWDTPYSVGGGGGNGSSDKYPLVSVPEGEGVIPTFTDTTDTADCETGSPFLFSTNISAVAPKNIEPVFAFVLYRFAGGEWSTAEMGNFSGGRREAKIVIPERAGSMWYSLILLNVNGDMSSGGIASVDIADAIPPKAKGEVDREVSEGRTGMFRAGGSTDNIGIASYLWTVYEGNERTEYSDRSASHRFMTAGDHRVVLTVTDARGNTDNATFDVEVSEWPGAAEFEQGGKDRSKELVFGCMAFWLLAVIVLVGASIVRARKARGPRFRIKRRIHGEKGAKGAVKNVRTVKVRKRKVKGGSDGEEGEEGR